MADYKTIRGTATFEYEEKRSRFIATASFADTEEKALAVLNAVRAANRTARHNVYAYVLQNGRTRYSGALQSAELVSMRLVVDCKVRVSYAQFEQAQRIIAAAETRLDEPIFDDALTLCWRMPAGQEETLRTALNELTRGGAEVEISAPQYAAF